MPVCVMVTCVCIPLCVCDGNMCMLACECEMGAYLCMPLCAVCICVHSCICAGKIVETTLCLQTFGPGHSHGAPQILWSQISTLWHAVQRSSLTDGLFSQWAVCSWRILLHRTIMQQASLGAVSLAGVPFLGLLRSIPPLWSTEGVLLMIL